MREYFCYSFKIGWYSEPMSKWVLHDLKIPAYDVREAVISFFWHLEYGQRVNNKWMASQKEFIMPDKDFVFHKIRQAIEWKISKKRGHFLVQYKKVRLITSHEILTYFK